MTKLHVAALAFVLSASGCATEYVLTRTGEASLPARAPNCSFKVLTAPPSGPYQEVGALDFKPGGVVPMTVPDFQTAVQSKVCAAGGNAVIALPNGMGQYIKGTILMLGASTPEDAQKMAAEMATQDKAAADKANAGKPPQSHCAQDNPAWATASAAEKKQILDACNASGAESATAPAP